MVFSTESGPMDFYARFGLGPDATGEEITRAYRRIAILTHPDKTGSPNTEAFLEAKWIREVLTEPELRRVYNRFEDGAKLGRALAKKHPLDNLPEVIVISDTSSEGASPPGSRESTPVGSAASTNSEAEEEPENPDEFGVEAVVDVARIGSDIFYQVKWAGFQETTWEPIENLAGYPEPLHDSKEPLGHYLNRYP